MKDLAPHHPARPMGFPTASRAPQAGPGLRTRWEISPQTTRTGSRWETSQRSTRTDSPMRNIPANRSDRNSNGRYPSERPKPTARWKISQRTTRAEGSMGDIPANHPSRQPDGRHPSARPGTTAQWEITPWTTWSDSSMGDIPANHPDRQFDGKYPLQPSGPTARREISQRSTWTDGSMRDIQCTPRTDGSMGNLPACRSGRGIDGRCPGEPSEPRDRWEMSQRAARVEGSLQDFPAGPGVGHSAAPTLPPRLGCSLHQAGEARPGSCREVKRRKHNSPSHLATAA